VRLKRDVGIGFSSDVVYRRGYVVGKKWIWTLTDRGRGVTYGGVNTLGWLLKWKQPLAVEEDGTVVLAPGAVYDGAPKDPVPPPQSKRSLEEFVKKGTPAADTDRP
jgi:hypothetical protein